MFGFLELFAEAIGVVWGVVPKLDGAQKAWVVVAWRYGGQVVVLEEPDGYEVVPFVTGSVKVHGIEELHDPIDFERISVGDDEIGACVVMVSMIDASGEESGEEFGIGVRVPHVVCRDDIVVRSVCK